MGTALSYGISPKFRDVVHLFILIGLISANKSISLFPSLIFYVVFCKDIRRHGRWVKLERQNEKGTCLEENLNASKPS